MTKIVLQISHTFCQNKGYIKKCISIIFRWELEWMQFYVLKL